MATAIESGSSGPRVLDFQRALDRELKHFKFPWRKIVIDGKAGAKTFDAANMVAWLKGFSDDELIKIGKRQQVSVRDLMILEGQERRSPAMVLRSRKRRRKARKLRYEHHHPGPQPIPGSPYKTPLDGHEVPIWIAEILLAARSTGAWGGVVISGVRTPAYSEQLCLNMCGAPSCSGMCAGRSSNHACPPSGEGVPYEGAVDVTDYYGLRHYCEAHAPQLRGGGQVLPRDLPHFSHVGN